MEDKTKWGKVRLLDKRITDKTSKPKSQYVSHPDSVFDELELGIEMNTSSKFSHGYKPNKNQER